MLFRSTTYILYCRLLLVPNLVLYLYSCVNKIICRQRCCNSMSYSHNKLNSSRDVSIWRVIYFQRTDWMPMGDQFIETVRVANPGPAKKYCFIGQQRDPDWSRHSPEDCACPRWAVVACHLWFGTNSPSAVHLDWLTDRSWRPVLLLALEGILILQSLLVTYHRCFQWHRRRDSSSN